MLKSRVLRWAAIGTGLLLGLGLGGCGMGGIVGLGAAGLAALTVLNGGLTGT
jgi:hypothetical protein